jgi:hypothetical protein
MAFQFQVNFIGVGCHQLAHHLDVHSKETAVSLSCDENDMPIFRSVMCKGNSVVMSVSDAMDPNKGSVVISYDPWINKLFVAHWRGLCLDRHSIIDSFFVDQRETKSFGDWAETFEFDFPLPLFLGMTCVVRIERDRDVKMEDVPITESIKFSRSLAT